MAVAYFGCYFVPAGLNRRNVHAFTTDTSIPERREWVVVNVGLDYTESDLTTDYTTQQLWDNGTEITNEYRWALIQIAIKGEDYIAASQARYDSWDTDDTATKLITVHANHLSQIKQEKMLWKMAKDTLNIIDV